MKHNTTGPCRCHRCAAIAAGMTAKEADAQHAKWVSEQMQKHGWIADLVADDPDSPTGFNLHTHGLQESYGHPDFQIVVPLPEKVGHGLLITLAERVKAGERFQAGQLVADVVRGMPVKMIDAIECSRPVLRVILPDKHGKVELGEIDEKFARQYDDPPPGGAP